MTQWNDCGYGRVNSGECQGVGGSGFLTGQGFSGQVWWKWICKN